MRSILFCAATAAVLTACGRDAVPEQQTPAGRVVTARPATPASLTLDDFKRLRWLDGRWQGFMADGGKFYEQYRVLDDSTMVMHSYPDSTFATPNDSARVLFRNGVVSNEGQRSRWVATRLDSAGADFAPVRGANNRFTWAREDSTKWNATIRWTDDQGVPQSVLYALRKLGK